MQTDLNHFDLEKHLEAKVERLSPFQQGKFTNSRQYEELKATVEYYKNF